MVRSQSQRAQTKGGPLVNTGRGQGLSAGGSLGARRGMLGRRTVREAWRARATPGAPPWGAPRSPSGAVRAVEGRWRAVNTGQAAPRSARDPPGARRPIGQRAPRLAGRVPVWNTPKGGSDLPNLTRMEGVFSRVTLDRARRPLLASTVAGALASMFPPARRGGPLS